jgi:hypothetical protein
MCMAIKLSGLGSYIHRVATELRIEEVAERDRKRIHP